MNSYYFSQYKITLSKLTSSTVNKLLLFCCLFFNQKRVRLRERERRVRDKNSKRFYLERKILEWKKFVEIANLLKACYQTYFSLHLTFSFCFSHVESNQRFKSSSLSLFLLFLISFLVRTFFFTFFILLYTFLLDRFN